MQTRTWMALVVGAWGCSKPPPPAPVIAPEVAVAPTASVAVVIAPADGGSPPADAPDAAAPAVSVDRSWPTRADDTRWVRALPRAKSFAVFDQLARAGDAKPIDFTWRVHPSHRIAGAPPGEEYPSLYEGKVELLASRGDVTKRFDLGMHSGTPEGASLTYCDRKGYRQPPGEGWSFPQLPNMVSAFEIATMQGSTEYAILLGRETMHVIRRHTHDGSCPTQVTQGPLRVCVDMQWQQLLELKVSGEPRITESVVTVDDVQKATPVDCKASYSGSRLLDPTP